MAENLPLDSLVQCLMGSEEENLERLKVSEEYLDCAKADSKAAKLLYEQKLYALSVYHLQQAVEKACKSFGIITFSIALKDVREINHQSPLTFARMLRANSWMLDMVKQDNPEIRTDIESLEKVIKNKGNGVELVSKEHILKFLESSEKYSAPINGLKDSLQILESIPGLEGKIEKLLEIITDFIGLYTLSCITYPHFMSTRYPDQHLKPRDYKVGLGIVDSFDELSKRTDKSINSLEEYLTILNVDSIKKS